MADTGGLLPGYDALVVGVSTGGINALRKIVPFLSVRLRLPVIVVQHLHPEGGNYPVRALRGLSALRVKEAEDGEIAVPGHVYIAPPGKHLLVKNGGMLTFFRGRPVNFARPSIDLLFAAASRVYGERLMGLILTGANKDGSLGLKRVGERGGLTLVQEPGTAEADSMPRSALRAARVDHVLTLENIAPFINAVAGG